MLDDLFQLTVPNASNEADHLPDERPTLPVPEAIPPVDSIQPNIDETEPEESLEELKEEEVDPPRKRGRGRPGAKPKEKADSGVPPPCRNICRAGQGIGIWARGRNARAIKDELCQTLGPFVMDQDTSWDDFISKIASDLGCTPEAVVLTGMSWVFVKPKNSLPFESQRGFIDMCKQISMKKGEKTVIIKVTRPEHANATAITVGNAISSLSVQKNGGSSIYVQGSTVFDEPTDGFSGVTVRAKVG
ncbi:hypothetical protein PIIN_10329 [Serendipita indica DSM 11827]|uniref:Uncharacterized protein n=1 Tax=Serendipita indica (strain DSM 11827) TaxID=1109443 RepID=G4TYE1_SERID|nr:hypothetical protein PIIN_10329 [Serendipita indica DSM 11827]